MFYVFHIPQAIYLFTAASMLAFNLHFHGEKKSNDRYDFPTACIGICIEFLVLYSGGFFK